VLGDAQKGGSPISSAMAHAPTGSLSSGGSVLRSGNHSSSTSPASRYGGAVDREPAGVVQVVDPSGPRSTCQPAWVLQRWWRRHRGLVLWGSVGPPRSCSTVCSQSQRDAATAHPGKSHVGSAASRNRRSTAFGRYVAVPIAISSPESGAVVKRNQSPSARGDRPVADQLARIVTKSEQGQDATSCGDPGPLALSLRQVRVG
jgi:hypothetical protein